MSHARVSSRRAEFEGEPSKEAFLALVSEELSLLSAQKTRVEAAAAVEKAAREREDAMRARIAAVKAKMEETRRKMPAPTEAVRDAADLRVYCGEYEALLKEFTTRKQTLAHVLSYQPADFKQADLSVVSRWLDTWGPFLSEAEAACKSLKRRERNTPGADRFLPATKDLYAALDDVCRLQLQARSLVGRERYRRSATSADSVEDFMDNQRQLLEWCRKQRQTLDSLNTLEDLQQFSSSFHANVPVMDSNFLVLSEQCELLAANPRVQDAMKEVNVAWVDLCLGTYEAVRAASRREHRASGIEEDATSWARDIAPQTEQLLRRAKALLSNEDDAVSGAADAKRLLKRCDKVLREQDAYRIVSIHLADYDIREECVAPHFDALSSELQSNMTSTVLSFPCVVEYEGRLEYKNRVDELREWIDVKSQKGTYLKLLERLEDTKKMIEEYADALFPEEDAETS